MKLKSLRSITKTIENASEIAKEVATDKDKLNELQASLAELRTQLMLSGSGASITKITICALVAWVVGVVSYIFLKNPADLVYAKDYAIVVGTVMGLITGGFVTGTSLKRKMR